MERKKYKKEAKARLWNENFILKKIIHFPTAGLSTSFLALLPFLPSFKTSNSGHLLNPPQVLVSL